MKQRKFKFSIDCSEGPIHLIIRDVDHENGYTADQICSFVKAFAKEGVISPEQEFRICAKIKLIGEEKANET